MNIEEIVTDPNLFWKIKKDASRNATTAAYRVNRYPMPAVEFYKYSAKEPNLTGWLYNDVRGQNNMDPWTMIEGIDASTDGKEYYLEYGQYGSKTVGGDFVVWVQS